METETVICGCRTSVLTQIIAWIHIIASFAGLIYSGIAAAVDLFELELSQEPAGQPDGIRWASILFAFAVIATLALLLGTLLLAGTIQRNANLLKLWIVAEIFFSLGTLTFLAIDVLDLKLCTNGAAIGVIGYVLASLYALAVIGYRIHDIESAPPPYPKQVFHDFVRV